MIGPSESEQKRLDHTLSTPLSNNQLRMIGKIAILWNSSEVHFEQLIWLAANWSNRTGALVTTDMPNVSRIQLARNFANLNIKVAPTREFTLETIKLFDAIRQRRNRVLHGLPVVEQSETIALKSESRSAKAGKGEIRRPASDISEKHLSFLIDSLAILNVAVEAAIHLIWRTQLVAHHQMLPPENWDDAVANSTLLRIEHVRNALDRLRRRPTD